ncbi:alpha/beta hydrolase [Saccharothrix sp. S26]|uniref:alpha/beta hydrolase n=1 Tax=Saccharothrix sp. S26 TaxID=2907215 RepID=UPI001F483627|nr:alpha/beta hydrolase [Saccharothrix sp. S26]MCE6997866.1 alpha/beta hydrolase [Saccharothrix sp. S26]
MGEVPIKANTVLPARREAVTLRTVDGLGLVGELALPVDRQPVATVVLLHPLPTHGGMMDSHLYRKAAWRLPALAGLAVLRFNTRGTASAAGCSEGAFDHAVGERLDVAAALAFAAERGLPRVWLVGWSFGTDLALMHGCEPMVEGTVLISPPLRWSKAEHLRTWARSGKPVVCLVPEFDTYLPPAEARRRFGADIPTADVIDFPGAKHLMVGHTEEVLDAIVSAAVPEVPTPLPRTWSGPHERYQATIVAS